jgi:hypothetical protein
MTDYNVHRHLNPEGIVRGITHTHLEGAYSHKHRRHPDWEHKPKHSVPTVEQLESWLSDGGCETTDGCWTEPDGSCEHGKPSWLMALNMI